MDKALAHINQRLFLIVLLSFSLTPLLGYSIAWSFGMISDSQINSLNLLLLSAVMATLLASCYIQFRNFLRPVLNWVEKHPHGAMLPDELSRHLKGFSSNYWAYFLLYAMLLPTTQHLLNISAPDLSAGSSLLQTSLLHLSVAIYVGMPGYLLSLSTLGKLMRFTGLPSILISMKTKMLLIGGYLPLLTMTIMLKYYWWRTNFVSWEIMLVWASMGLAAFTLAILASRSLSQSLKPVYEVISGVGASSYSALAKRLRPQSTDEVGYIVQTLGKLFRRLGDQEAYVHAIIDNVAEGIIVIDADGQIVTFNPAAEQLFGYNKHEIKGKTLVWLLPELIGENQLPLTTDGDQETIGQRANGKKVPMSVRFNEMEMNDHRFLTCLVADISERKASETQLIEAQARYRDLVETAHDLVWSMDIEGRWTYLNEAVDHIYGYSVEQMLEKPFTDFQASESAQRDIEAFRQVINGEELLQYETVHLNAEGEERHISFNARPLHDEKGNVIRITGTARDITDQKIFERELTYQAQHDSLTGLYNRNYFQKELERLITRVARSGASCALMYIDLDQFKYVNDTVGHAAGDRLLLECTNMLRKHIREGDLLARFGGDEFTVLLYSVDEAAARKVAENIRSLFEAFRFLDSGKTFNVTCSIGVALIDNQVNSADDVMSQADLACNISKTQGRNNVHMYNPQDNDKAGMAEDIGWATRVRDAIDKDFFKLYFQPIYSLTTDTVHDYEVLLRMTTESGDIIMPSGFMPAAERFGLAHNVDRWTVRHSMEHLALLQQDDASIQFAINLSGRAFEDKTLLPMIDDILREHNLNPASLTFEITETAAIADLQAAMHFIGKLKDLGCQFALDDFGSGFCSFTYLKHLPVDKLKIDGAFVQGLAHATVDQAMVKSMNQVAHALGKTTIAEFVENAATLAMLKEIGVDYAQGHYLGKPTAQIAKPILSEAKLLLN